MAKVKLFDEFGIIHEANKTLPDNEHKIAFMEALAELEENNCHRERFFPKTRLHKVKGIRQAIYRADINKTSGWRLHLQFHKESGQLDLKDVIQGQLHDDVNRVIKSKRGRYE